LVAEVRGRLPGGTGRRPSRQLRDRLLALPYSKAHINFAFELLRRTRPPQLPPGSNELCASDSGLCARLCDPGPYPCAI